MIIIYHNPRCSKSRACNLLLDTKGQDFKVVNYMTEPFTLSSLKKVIALLKIKPIELIRKNEKIWKEHFKGKEMSQEEIVMAMVEYPKLIQRPIVVNGKKAVIARPAELIEEIL